jgi:hypothetical protein
MHRCQALQAQLLEYLYDLLDADERRAAQDHLDGCAACQAELTRVRGQQRLLAAAARLEFPAVQFTPPAEAVTAEPPAAAPARTVPLPAAAPRAARRFAWRRWAVAAAVLLALGGAAVPAAALWGDYSQACRTVADHDAVVAEAKQRRDDAAAKVRDLQKEENDRVKGVSDKYHASQLLLAVVGPATVQSGAPTKYEIQTTDLDGRPVAAEITARVADARGQKGDPIPVVGAQKAGAYDLLLPPDLALKPNDKLTLVVSAKREAGLETAVQEELSLAAPVYVTHLATDRPMYQPGDVVHFRSLTLDRFSLRPAQEDLRLVYTVTTPKKQQTPVLLAANNLRDEAAPPLTPSPLPPGERGRGEGRDGKAPAPNPLRGVGAGEFRLDPTADGGEYTLTVREENNRFPEQTRKFTVIEHKPQQFNKELDFGRSSYGPGDEVTARCKATRGRDPLRRAAVDAEVLVDGQPYGADGQPNAQPMHFQTDDQGVVVVRFRLPPTIERGQAMLGVTFHEGVAEAMARPIPVVLKKLTVEFYPEGGDLVADLPNRVYFEARTPLGKPADLVGRLLEDGKPLPVVVQTMHDKDEPGVNHGMGRFEFTPKAHSSYELQVDSPAGIAERYPLPKVEDDKVVLRVPQGVAGPADPIKVEVRSKRERDLMVGLYCRGRLLHSARLKKGESEATLTPEAGAGGVCRVTVFEDRPGAASRELVPVAERLIFRRPAEKLDVALRPDRPGYVPGQKAGLAVEARDEKGAAADGVAMVAVVDKSVLTLADEKTYRSMPTHFLLTSEVKRPEDLEYADFLLGPDPRAADALDLLLGVQGWRRFAEQDPARFRERNADKEEAERLLVLTGQSAPRKTDFVEDQVKAVREEIQAKRAELTAARDAAQADVDAAAADAGYVAARAKAAQYARGWDEARGVATPLLGSLLLLAALACLVVGLSRGLKRGAPYFAGAAACVVLLVGVVQLYRLGGRACPPPTPSADDQFAVADPGAPMPAPDDKNERDQENPAAGFGFGRPGDVALGLPGGGQGPANMPPAPGGPPAPKDDGKADRPAPVPAAPPGVPGPGGPAGKPGDDKGKDKAGGGFGGRPEEFARGGEGKGGDPNAALKVPDMDNGFAPRAADPARHKDRKEKDLAKKDAEVLVARDRLEEQERAAQNLGALQQIFDEKAKREGLDGKPRAPLPPMVVRQFAHRRTAGETPEQRIDWAETVYWHPALLLPGGKADVGFELSDAATTYQATAFVHTADGRLGVGVQTFDARLPLTVQPTTPVEVTAGDLIDLPVNVVNNTPDGRDVRLALTKHDNLELLKGQTEAGLAVAGNTAVRKTFRFRPTVHEGEAAVGFQGRTAEYPADDRLDRFRVVPEGFPVVGARSDLLEGTAAQTVELPETWVKGTLKCRVEVYPSTLADLQKGLDSLLREPNGCFEQTSSSNYPNLLILDYLRQSDQARPEVERRARELVARGYQKLTSFECTDPAKNAKKGYEWFGGTAPAHEALTAYGLMEFRDTARVQDVDAAMMDRTRAYLLGQWDAAARHFKRNPRALDSFGRAPEGVTDAYIVWALTEGGKDDLSKQLDALAEQAKSSKDPYFLSLVANAQLNSGKGPEAAALLKTVAAAQKDDGHLDAEKTSITGSGGRDLQIETTALAVLGWLKANNPAEFNANVQKAVKWIGQQRGGYGGFGSTQSTILALKALILYTKANKRTPEAGELRLFVGGREAAKLAFPAGASEALTLELPDAETRLRPGRNEVRVEVTGKNVFPYTLAWSYQTLKPASADDCPVRLETKLAKAEAVEGGLVHLDVTLENVSGQGQGMAVAVIGLPGGAGVPEDMKQLKQYARTPEDGSRPLVSAFELRGRELVLYWRDLAPGQKITVPLDLICRVPGEYRGPASRAYLYYNADHKHWVEPLRLTIVAAE